MKNLIENCWFADELRECFRQQLKTYYILSFYEARETEHLDLVNSTFPTLLSAHTGNNACIEF